MVKIQSLEVELAVVKNEVKNISDKLDVHINDGKVDSDDNKKSQKDILTKLDVFHKLLATKADQKDVDKLRANFAYWAGAFAVIVFLITLIATNIDKIFQRI